MTVRLRPAGSADAYPLWLWANDPSTRAASGHRPLIPWTAHLEWLAGRLDLDRALVWIAETVEGQPVGTIRFETTDQWSSALLSYVVAPEARGRGFGRALLTQGVAVMRRLNPATTLHAVVRADNAISRHLFVELGWNGRNVGDEIHLTPPGGDPR